MNNPVLEQAVIELLVFLLSVALLYFYMDQ